MSALITSAEEQSSLPMDVQFGHYSELLVPQNDLPQNIGLSYEDYQRVLEAPETTKVGVTTLNGEVRVPLLTSIDIFPWYNLDMIKGSQPEGTEIRYIPPVPQAVGLVDKAKIDTTIMDELDRGTALLIDCDRNDPASRIEPLIKIAQEADARLIIENLGGGDQERYLNQYVATVDFGGGETSFRAGGSLYTYYEKMVQDGELPKDVDNGPSFILKLDNDVERDKLWQIYKKRFDKLGEEHPVNAGYGEEEFKAILQDPDVVKVVNRVDGDISTLCLFLTDITQCPWLNQQYYKEHYKEAIDSGNFLIFLGIVTDEKMQGNAYATDVVDLLVHVSDEKHASTVITFECNEISQNITPILVQSAIENSGIAKVSGLEEPTSQLSFYTVRKQN